jgi:hypothetical protein
MKKIFLLLAGSLAISFSVSSQEMMAARCLKNGYPHRDINRSAPSGCTVITVSKGGKVLFGGNDDYVNADSYYWVEQGDSSRYGVIWIGTPDNPQQGVNEKGLAYDANGLPRVKTNPHSERITFGDEYHNYVMNILHECSTIDEVTEWIGKHQRPPYMHDQLHFADRNGDAVIISAGEDGEMVFTRKPPGDGFLVSTNFNVANPSNGFNYPCWRYDKASELLGELMKKADRPSFNDLTGIMDAVHVEKGSSWTIETLVADLTGGILYLYFFYQYDRPVVINVSEELSNPRQAGPLSNLFPEDVRKEAARRYMAATSTIKMNRIIGMSWGGLLIISLALVLILTGRDRGLRFWIPAVIVIGPVALCVRLMCRKSGTTTANKSALVETTGNITPVVIGYIVSQVILVLKAVSGGISEKQQVLYIIGLPLLTAWIIFQGPLLATAGKINFVRFLWHRFPQVLVTVLLSLAGIFTVSLTLVNKTLAMSQVIPLSPWIVLTWWAITVAGSLPGGLLVFFYEKWATNRGYRAWSIFAGAEGEITTPGWGKIWWWVLVSILILLAGLVAGVILNKLFTT